MPFILPGLFDFTTGVTSAINQQNGRLTNDALRTSNYVDSLNAFNQSLNTNDNLQFRQAFAEGVGNGGSFLDGAQNAAASNNVFAALNGLTAATTATPQLGLQSLLNPAFAQAQGLPSNINALLAGGGFGGQAAAQVAFNQQTLPNLLGQFNPQLNPNLLGQSLQTTRNAGVQNDSLLFLQQMLAQQQAQQAEVQRQLAASQIVAQQAQAQPQQQAAPLPDVFAMTNGRTQVPDSTSTQSTVRPPAAAAINPAVSSAVVGGQQNSRQ